MKTLTEIVRQKGMRTAGRTVFREAVRGIIARGPELLLVYSTHNGDYKFPGGGVQPGESHQAALAREIREECGATVTAIREAFGKVIEYDVPLEADYDVFRMDSYYYPCQVESLLGRQVLDPYEADLGFTPVWVNINTAIEANRAVLAGDRRQAPRWTTRDLFVLEQVRARLGDGF